MSREDRIPEGNDLTAALDAAVSRGRGMGLPSHPHARRRTVERFRDEWDNLSPGAKLSKIGMMSPGGGSLGGGSFRTAMPKTYDPLMSPVNKDIPYYDDAETPENEKMRRLARAWCRFYYMTHHLVATCIDIFARYPLVGIEHECSDPGIKEFYDDLFFNDLGYEEYLTALGTEFWKVGEAFPMGDWSANLGVWVADKLMNQDDIVVQQNDYLGLKRYYFKIDEDDKDHPLKRLVETQQPSDEYEALITTSPDLVEAIKKNEGIEITPGLMSQIKHGGDTWSKRGYPLLMRAFRQLLLEERLNRAQLAISERLYTPLILLLLGHDGLGEDGEPWIPTGGDIARTQMMFENIMTSEYRTLVHHFGLNIQVPLSGERMPNLNADYDRVEIATLGVFGISRELISGGSGNAYATTAISAEFLMQRLKTYQSGITKWVRDERYRQVAQKQGFYEKEKRGDTYVDKWEEYLVRMPDGTDEVRKRKKLLIPHM